MSRYLCVGGVRNTLGTSDIDCNDFLSKLNTKCNFTKKSTGPTAFANLLFIYLKIFFGKVDFHNLTLL